MKLSPGHAYSLVRDWSGHNVNVRVEGYAATTTGCDGVVVSVQSERELLVDALTGETRQIGRLLLVPRVVGETVYDESSHGLYVNVYDVSDEDRLDGLDLNQYEAIDRAFLVDLFHDET